MSERDVRRIGVLSEVLNGRRTVGSAAAVLEMTPRQARRLLARLRDGGGGAIGHRLRGRPSNRRIEPEVASSRSIWFASDTLISARRWQPRSLRNCTV